MAGRQTRRSNCNFFRSRGVTVDNFTFWLVNLIQCYNTYILEREKVCITEIWIYLEPAAIPAWNCVEICSTPVQMNTNPSHVSFRKQSWSLHILCDLKFCTATLMKHRDRAAFVLRMFLFTLKQQKNMCFFRLALSMTCTDTLHLSDDNCLQDDGMLEPGILHSRVAAHFSFHSHTNIILRTHYHVSFTACDCLRPHHQRAISK